MLAVCCTYRATRYDIDGFMHCGRVGVGIVGIREVLRHCGML
jgi:hypothetical protein